MRCNLAPGGCVALSNPSYKELLHSRVSSADIFSILTLLLLSLDSTGTYFEPSRRNTKYDEFDKTYKTNSDISVLR